VPISDKNIPLPQTEIFTQLLKQLYQLQSGSVCKTMIFLLSCCKVVNMLTMHKHTYTNTYTHMALSYIIGFTSSLIPPASCRIILFWTCIITLITVLYQQVYIYIYISINISFVHSIQRFMDFQRSFWHHIHHNKNIKS